MTSNVTARLELKDGQWVLYIEGERWMMDDVENKAHEGGTFVYTGGMLESDHPEKYRMNFAMMPRR